MDVKKFLSLSVKLMKTRLKGCYCSKLVADSSEPLKSKGLLKVLKDFKKQHCSPNLMNV